MEAWAIVGGTSYPGLCRRTGPQGGCSPTASGDEPCLTNTTGGGESYAQLVGAIQKLMLAILDATRKMREDMAGDIFGGARNRRKLVHAAAPTLGDQATARKIRQNAHASPNMGKGPKEGRRAALTAYLGGLEWTPR